MHVTTLEGPGKNALGTRMMDHLTREASVAGGRPWLLVGAGDAFSAGLDLKEVVALDRAGLQDFLVRLDDLVALLWTYPGPTAAAVTGHAIAGGAVVACCCDHRVGRPGSGRMGLNEVAIGLRFPPKVWHVVRQRVPVHHHESVLLGADLFTIEAALRLGLLDATDDDPTAAASAWLERVGRHPAGAYAAAKADLRSGLPERDASWDQFVQGVVPAWDTPGVRESIRRILTRR